MIVMVTASAGTEYLNHNRCDSETY